MKITTKILISILTVFIPYISKVSAQQPERYFQYPVPPENLETLNERTTYLVEHFWDFCNLKSAFSSKQKMSEAFGDYVSFMPYADSLAVMQSIDKLIKEVKKNQNNMLSLAHMAEGILYSDTAEYRIDEVYLPFAQTTANLGGISKEEKEKYALQASQLSNSLVGKKIPSLKLILRDGTEKNFDEITGTYILILVDDPENSDNMMARVRLSADYSLNELIKRGYLTVISLYPGAADSEWVERTAGYPNNWVVAASPGSDRLIDMRVKPTIYYLNKDHELLSKSLYAENLLEAFRVVLANQNQVKEQREKLRQEALKKKAEESQN